MAVNYYIFVIRKDNDKNIRQIVSKCPIKEKLSMSNKATTIVHTRTQIIAAAMDQISTGHMLPVRIHSQEQESAMCCFRSPIPIAAWLR